MFDAHCASRTTPLLGSANSCRLRSVDVARRMCSAFNPFIPKSDQYQISPAASPEILHHTVWRTWPFLAYSGARWLYYQLSLPSVIQFSLQGWENAVFELGSERVKYDDVLYVYIPVSRNSCYSQEFQCGPNSHAVESNKTILIILLKTDSLEPTGSMFYE